MTKRAALYLRVSTCEQTTTENQRRELEEVAKRSSWEIAGIYKDAGISGAKGREKGPDFDRLCNKALLRLTNDPATQFSVVERNAISDFQPPENFGNGAARAEPRVCQCRLLPQKELVADE